MKIGTSPNGHPLPHHGIAAETGTKDGGKIAQANGSVTIAGTVTGGAHATGRNIRTTGVVACGFKAKTQTKRKHPIGSMALNCETVLPPSHRGSGCPDDRFCAAPGDRMPNSPFAPANL